MAKLLHKKQNIIKQQKLMKAKIV